MSAVIGARRRATRTDPARQSPPPITASKPDPELKFTALDGLRGLAVPFVLAFALRADIAGLNPPNTVQYLADGGYVLVSLFFVLAGFLLCRPLRAILDGGDAGDLLKGLVRQIAPLHLAAWAITLGWLVTETSSGTVWGWLSGALLLNGIAGPERAGYPVSWSVSVALFCVIVLVAAALLLSFGVRSLRARGTRRTSRDDALPGSGRLATGVALTAGLIGTALLLPTGPEAPGTVGPAAIGQALLGLGAGMLCFRVLEGGTGTLNVPLPGTAPAPRPAPGLGALLALAALLVCVYRSDLAHELDLLPVFPAAAALVYFLALPNGSGQSPVNRVLEARPLQWLGSRTLALYLLHGPIQLTVERICELRGFDRESTPVGYGVLGAVVVGSLVAADLAHRLLNRTIASPKTVPVAAISVYRQPRSRPERISQIDPKAIPSELRLLPLPRKGTTSHQAPKTPEKPASQPTSTPIEAKTETPTPQSADVLVSNPISRPARKPIRRPITKPITLPPEPAANPVPVAPNTSDQPIDLDRPTDPDSPRILDADAEFLDADADSKP